MSLAGCSSETSLLEQALSGYAQSAERGYGFDLYLVDEALESALQTQAFLDQMRLVPIGRASFSQLQPSGSGSVEACMDLSQVIVFDSDGFLANLPPRTDRVLVSIDFRLTQDSALIRSLRVGGTEC